MSSFATLVAHRDLTPDIRELVLPPDGAAHDRVTPGSRR
jgi:hypothetical protein